MKYGEFSLCGKHFLSLILYIIFIFVSAYKGAKIICSENYMIHIYICKHAFMIYIEIDINKVLYLEPGEFTSLLDKCTLYYI